MSANKHLKTWKLTLLQLQQRFKGSRRTISTHGKACIFIGDSRKEAQALFSSSCNQRLYKPPAKKGHEQARGHWITNPVGNRTKWVWCVIQTKRSDKSSGPSRFYCWILVNKMKTRGKVVSRPCGWLVHTTCRRNWNSFTLTWRGSFGICNLSTVLDNQ